MPFKQMENINNFLIVMEKIGVPKHNLFMTVDLFENKSKMAVLVCICSFIRLANKKEWVNAPL